MRERWKRADDADSDQSERERDDIAFEAGEQWPADVKLARQGQQPINGMPAVPARPTLVINKVKEPIRQILNQERAADLGVEIVSADDFGDLGIVIDDSEIRLREGLVRRLQRESHAADARTWAYKRAVIAGRGFYLVSVRYLPGKTRDQEIYLHRIYEQAGVKLDPSHEAPDGSDSDWEFIGTWVPWDRYKAENPQFNGKDNPYTDYTAADFVGLTEEYPDWFKNTTDSVSTDGKRETVRGSAVRVVNYWHTKHVSHELATLEDGTYCWIEDVPKGITPVDTDMVIERTVRHCKVGGGLQFLDGTSEESEWAGPDMPIVKVLGDEILPFDNQRRAEGMVRPSRGAQMGENYMISKLVETIGLTPLSPLQVDPDAIDGYEEWYKVANTRTLPFLPSRTYDDQGRQLKEPHRPAVDPNIFPMAQAIQLFDQFIRSTTAVPDPTLGNVEPALKSGKSIQALTANAAQSTSNFLDNLARSIRYEGQIINNLLYPIYGAKPGRLVRILTGENEAQTIHISAPQPPTMPGQPVAPMPPPAPNAAKMAVLTKDAHFNVSIKVTKQYDVKREETAAFLGNIIAADPQQMGVVGDMLYRNIDVPGNSEMADRQKLMLAPPIQAYLASKEQGQAPLPPQVQQHMAQMAQQLQEAQQIIAKLAEDAKGHQLDYQGKVDVEKMRQQTDVTKAQLANELAITLQSMKDAAGIAEAKIAAGVSDQEAIDEAIALGHEHAQEATQAALDRQQEQTMQQTDQAHQAAMTAFQPSPAEGQPTSDQGQAAPQSAQPTTPAPTNGQPS